MELKLSPVFLANARANTKYVVNEGGTRSGKTYSILQTLILKHALTKKGQIIDIVRKTQRELHDTVIFDFVEILTTWGWYNERNHNKSRNIYTLNGNVFRFIGIDRAGKKKGAKRHILYCNEANGLTIEDWVQLSIRVTDKVYLDYNPEEEFWVDEFVMPKGPEMVTKIHSTYLDNYEFLEKDQIEQIESLIGIDDFYYNVYTLGKRAIRKGKIYSNIKRITQAQYDDVFEDVKFYGIDFGYEHYTVVVEIKWAGEQTYEKPIYYERHKTDNDLIEFLIKYGIDPDNSMYPDPAMSGSVRKLRDQGYNCRDVNKDVKDGIRFVQALKRNIVTDGPCGIQYWEENDKYKFKQTPDGRIIEEPVKIKDDGPDAGRYALYNELKQYYNPMGGL